MKGRNPLFDKIGVKYRFNLNLQLFAEKKVSDEGQRLQDQVLNPKLKNLIGELYRSGGTVGDGTAMAAASLQVKTGQLTKGKGHIIKIKERITNASNILKSQNLNKKDKKIINKLIKDMKNSLRGKY